MSWTDLNLSWTDRTIMDNFGQSRTNETFWTKRDILDKAGQNLSWTKIAHPTMETIGELGMGDRMGDSFQVRGTYLELA
jgi:hypothetical protein